MFKRIFQFFLLVFLVILISSCQVMPSFNPVFQSSSNSTYFSNLDSVDKNSETVGVKNQDSDQEISILENFSFGIGDTNVDKKNTTSEVDLNLETDAVLPTNEKESDLENRLYLASLEFIANTPDEANAIARKIDFASSDYETATNACGPISIAILKSAGILADTVSVHDIWYLCPRENEGREECNGMSVLERSYFPPQYYDYKRVTQSIDTYDFNSNPLYPGDWLYLFAGKTGFDHMMVVTKVDEKGVAYSVNNLSRGEGTKITEEVLYNPSNPGEGLFYELTNPSRGDLGMSGNGGFLLVRRKGGLSRNPVNTKDFSGILNPNATWNGLIKNINTEEIIYESLPNQKFHPASMIKIPMAMVTLKILENEGFSLKDFSGVTFEGLSLDKLLYKMVVNSDEDATNTLVWFVKNRGGGIDVLKKWGLFDTSLEPRSSTALDLGNLLEGLYLKKLLSAEMSDFLLDLMSVRTENDSKYLGVINSVFKDSLLFNKRGTILNPLIVGDMGILVVDETAYIIVICGSKKIDEVATFTDLAISIENFSLAFASLIS